MKIFNSILAVLVITLVLLLSGCKTDLANTMDSIKDSFSSSNDPNFNEDEFNVGPKINEELLAKDDAEVNIDRPSRKISIIIPSFDPNLEQKKKVRKNTTTQAGVGAGPADPASTSSSSDKIYPELRKVESKRFAIKLKDSLDKTNLLGAVRVTPDATASGEIYILGKINEKERPVFDVQSQ